MAKNKTTVITGFIPYGIHEKKGEMYFSISRQKWKSKIRKLRMSDIMSTPTVPLVYPNKTRRKFNELGVYKIEIIMEFPEPKINYGNKFEDLPE